MDNRHPSPSLGSDSGYLNFQGVVRVVCRDRDRRRCGGVRAESLHAPDERGRAGDVGNRDAPQIAGDRSAVRLGTDDLHKKIVYFPRLDGQPLRRSIEKNFRRRIVRGFSSENKPTILRISDPKIGYGELTGRMRKLPVSARVCLVSKRRRINAGGKIFPATRGCGIVAGCPVLVTSPDK